MLPNKRPGARGMTGPSCALDRAASDAGRSAMLRFVWLSSLLGRPAMFFNPLFSVFSGSKLADVTRTNFWPRNFDAPITRLRNRR